MDRLSDRELDDVTKALNLLIRVGDEARAELVGPLLETT
jgi:hypothetical protein